MNRVGAPSPVSLHRIIDLLRSLLTADGLYRHGEYGPLTPPLTLHAACLDIAAYACGVADNSGKMQVVDIVLQALPSSPRGIHDRTCDWLERTIPPLLALSSAHVHALSTKLLAALCSIINLNQPTITSIHRTHRLLAVTLKIVPEAATHLLEVAALGPATARRTAMAVLSTYYPHSIGHNIIARGPPTLTYAARLARWNTGYKIAYQEETTDVHHYIPWRISSKDLTTDPPGLRSCTVCEGEIHGFCIKCTLCGDVLHLDCHRSADGMFRYDLIDPSNPAQSLAPVIVQFSRELPFVSERLSEGTTKIARHGSIHRRIDDHDLHLIHLFTATTCASCSKPVFAQPRSTFACVSGCQGIFHAGCLDMMTERSDCGSRQVWPLSRFKVSPEDLAICGNSALSGLIIDPTHMEELTYDEIAVLYGALWIQYQIVKNGINIKALCLDYHAPGSSDPLNLRSTLRAYEAYLSSHSHKASSAAKDFAHIVGNAAPLAEDYLFSAQYLAYVTSLIRSPAPPPPDEGDRSKHGTPFRTAGSAEFADDASVWRVMAADLEVRQIAISTLLLDHLDLTGFLRQDQETASFPPSGRRLVYFDLPRLADTGPTTEYLVQAIAACLEDVDLAMNDQAAALLVQRAWPSLLCSPSALERLAASVMRWVICEASRPDSQILWLVPNTDRTGRDHASYR